MKITEMAWEDSKRYKDLYGNPWIVNGGGLYSEDDECITECYNLKSILKMDFEEFVDWSKVEVDTPIWVLLPDGIYRPSHFAKYENEKVYFWVSGRTSHSAENWAWVYKKDASLNKPKEV